MAEWIFKEKVSPLGYQYIDVVNRQELVRCKDCKYAQARVGHDIFCEFVDDGLGHDENWFCADGKRRDDASYG